MFGKNLTETLQGQKDKNPPRLVINGKKVITWFALHSRTFQQLCLPNDRTKHSFDQNISKPP